MGWYGRVRADLFVWVFFDIWATVKDARETGVHHQMDGSVLARREKESGLVVFVVVFLDFSLEAVSARALSLQQQPPCIATLESDYVWCGNAKWRPRLVV